jgi:thymidylate synthase
MNQQWVGQLKHILDLGQPVEPRGQKTLELLQSTIEVDMRRPVLTIPERKLSYQFMAAEAFWILSGDNSVMGIAPYNQHIARFSDDGEKFFGAYGPKVIDQLNYVIQKLVDDRDTRQAGMTIWRENPPPTKDVPCTVAIFFNIRGSVLNVHVFMRSSDAWLGLPYDVFNFSMLGHRVCGYFNAIGRSKNFLEVAPGRLFLTMASSHLYEQHYEAARAIVDTHFEVPDGWPVRPTPGQTFWDYDRLMPILEKLRTSKPGDELRWWEQKS